MAELKVDVESFSLTSTWYVGTGSNGSLSITSGPTTASKVVRFNYSLPSKAEIISAKVYSTWSSPNGGFATRTVNGTTPTSVDNGSVDIEIDPAASSADVVFQFKSYGNATSQGDHSGVTHISEISLLIEYKANNGSCLYHVEDGKLVPYNLYHVEDGKLVLYNLYHVEDGKLVKY